MWIASCAASSSRRLAAGARPWLVMVLLIWSGCGASLALGRDYPLEIIELRSRLPEELIPILAPLAGTDGTVVGAQHALFVRASPQRLADIRRALAELDRPARSLLIQVRQGSSLATSGARLGARVDESWGGGENGDRVRIGPPAGRDGSRLVASAGRGSAQRDITQEVRALDGHPAYIAIGSEQPLPYRELVVGPGGAVVRQGQEYWRAESGFTVTPRVLGDRVTLEVETRSASPGRQGAIDTGSVRSRVEGRLGEWIPIAADSDAGEAQSGGLFYGAQGRREIQGRVDLRVLPLD